MTVMMMNGFLFAFEGVPRVRLSDLRHAGLLLHPTGRYGGGLLPNLSGRQADRR